MLLKLEGGMKRLEGINRDRVKSLTKKSAKHRQQLKQEKKSDIAEPIADDATAEQEDLVVVAGGGEGGEAKNTTWQII